MNTMMHNIDGTLTKYAFACGYVQKFEGRFGELKLYMEFHTYHLIKSENLKPSVWLSFDKLGPAKKQFNKFKKEIK